MKNSINEEKDKSINVKQFIRKAKSRRKFAKERTIPLDHRS